MTLLRSILWSCSGPGSNGVVTVALPAFLQPIVAQSLCCAVYATRDPPTALMSLWTIRLCGTAICVGLWAVSPFMCTHGGSAVCYTRARPGVQAVVRSHAITNSGPEAGPVTDSVTATVECKHSPNTVRAVPVAACNSTTTVTATVRGVQPKWETL